MYSSKAVGLAGKSSFNTPRKAFCLVKKGRQTSQGFGRIGKVLPEEYG
jgi:hypothetical protein